MNTGFLYIGHHGNNISVVDRLAGADHIAFFSIEHFFYQFAAEPLIPVTKKSIGFRLVATSLL
jgi:hypothetical protein